MRYRSIGGPFLFTFLTAVTLLGFRGPAGLATVRAADPAATPHDAPAPDNQTNQLQKILETQQALLNAVQRVREESEDAARRNAEALQKLSEETAAATLRTRDELLKNSGALEMLVVRQFESQVEILQKMNHSTVLTFGALIGLGLMAFVGVSIVLWRALRRLSEPRWAQAHAAIGPGEAMPALAGEPAKALPASVQKLEKLEKRILQLEHDAASGRNGGKSSPATTQGTGAARTRRDAARKESAEVREALEAGQASLKAGQAEQALDHFLRAIRAGPAGGEPYLWKGTALEQLGRLEEALAAYDEAITADPALNTAHLRKGGLCNRLGRMDEAFHSFERVLETLGKPQGA